METSIKELKDRFVGYDIWVVASGKSADFVDPSFFDNKIAIGVNEVWKRFNNLDYLVRKEAQRSDEAIASGIPLIMSRHSCGTTSFKRNHIASPIDYYIFEHDDNRVEKEIDLSVIDRNSDKIVVSYSTITSAIHVAAYIGASNIILVGHDCGSLDGFQNMSVYPPPLHPAGRVFYSEFLSKIEDQTIAVRERIKEVYGANIYSLNPFLNFGLEGHHWERTA